MQRKKQRGGVPAEHIVSDEARNSRAAFRFDFARFDSDWKRSRDSEINSYLVIIGSSKAYLRNRANEKKQLAIAMEMGELRVRQAMLIEVGHALGSETTSNEARDVKKEMLKLGALAKTWPALDEPSAELEGELNEITQEAPFQNWNTDSRRALEHAQELVDRRGTYPTTHSSPVRLPRPSDNPFPELLPDRQNTKEITNKNQSLDITLPAILSSIYPLDRIQSLTSYCDGRLMRAVGENYSSASQTRALRAVLGPQYSTYYDRWQADMARLQEQHQEATRKQQEADRKAVEQEQFRKIEVREHPVEIP